MSKKEKADMAFEGSYLEGDKVARGRPESPLNDFGSSSLSGEQLSTNMGGIHYNLFNSVSVGGTFGRLAGVISGTSSKLDLD